MNRFVKDARRRLYGLKPFELTSQSTSISSILSTRPSRSLFSTQCTPSSSFPTRLSYQHLMSTPEHQIAAVWGQRKLHDQRKTFKDRVRRDVSSRGPSRVLAHTLLVRLEEWATSDRVKRRLEAYGLNHDTATTTLRAWRESVSTKLRDILKADQNQNPSSAGKLSKQASNSNILPNQPLVSSDYEAISQIGFDVPSLRLAQDAGDPGQVFESAFHRHHLTFCLTHPLIPPHLNLHLRALLRATDISRLASTSYVAARSMSRHFHLHVGPTNSGKTYSALKAMSRARTGVYAGPLRLLAHEVWERVNLGTVGGMDGVGKKCNLLTGEERRIVDPDAGLLSCTVEMVPSTGPGGEPWDVVVIDEIQMMGDPARGGAWTAAVMGVSAKEIHLCGDDTAVELLESMVASFGTDKLTVHRYERLTPLKVADSSLDGDWSRVNAGDCVVTFSRTGIFAVKRLVEKQTGKKCAVVYGALPPETRAEQARDFNDEFGRAQVLVASDAIGMGLNLKINRIIFESLTKFDGRKDVPLPLTQIKQIAGRAGRFGMQRKSQTPPEPDSTLSSSPTPDSTSNSALSDSDGSDSGAPNPSLSGPDEIPSSGGEVTTLHAEDLPTLRDALPKPLPPLTRAVIEVPYSVLSDLSALLPPQTPFDELQDHVSALVCLPAKTVLGSSDQKLAQMRVVEPYRDQLGLHEADLFSYAPVNRRDERVMGVFTAIVDSYAQSGVVNINDVLESSSSSNMLNTLKMVEEILESLPPLDYNSTLTESRKTPRTPAILSSSLPLLESLHKSLVLYIWLSFRLDINFPDRSEAVKMKERTEKVLEACLERLPFPSKSNKNRTRMSSRGRRVKDGKAFERSSEGIGNGGEKSSIGNFGIRSKSGKSEENKKKSSVDWMDRDQLRRRISKRQWGQVSLMESV